MSPSPPPPSHRQSSMREFLKDLAGTGEASSSKRRHKHTDESKDKTEKKQQVLTFERNEQTSAVEALAAKRAAKQARQAAEVEHTLGTPFETPPASQKAIEISDDNPSEATVGGDEEVPVHTPPGETQAAPEAYYSQPQPKSIRHALAESIRSIGGTPPKSLLRPSTHAAAILSSSSSSSTFTPSPSTFSLAPKRALSHLLPREASTEQLLAGKHHIYYDATGFGYNILLTRADLKRNKIERVVVRLYETHTLPASYAVFERYTAPGKDAIEEVACPVGSTFAEAFGVFRRVFEKWAEVRWEDRQRPSPATRGKDDVKNGKGKEETGGEKPFRYIRPKEGMPTGVEMWHGVTREEKIERELDEEFAGL